MHPLPQPVDCKYNIFPTKLANTTGLTFYTCIRGKKNTQKITVSVFASDRFSFAAAAAGFLAMQLLGCLAHWTAGRGKSWPGGSWLLAITRLCLVDWVVIYEPSHTYDWQLLVGNNR